MLSLVAVSKFDLHLPKPGIAHGILFVTHDLPTFAPFLFIFSSASFTFQQPSPTLLFPILLELERQVKMLCFHAFTLHTQTTVAYLETDERRMKWCALQVWILILDHKPVRCGGPTHRLTLDLKKITFRKTST